MGQLSTPQTRFKSAFDSFWNPELNAQTISQPIFPLHREVEGVSVRIDFLRTKGISGPELADSDYEEIQKLDAAHEATHTALSNLVENMGEAIRFLKSEGMTLPKNITVYLVYSKGSGSGQRSYSRKAYDAKFATDIWIDIEEGFKADTFVHEITHNITPNIVSTDRFLAEGFAQWFALRFDHGTPYEAQTYVDIDGHKFYSSPHSSYALNEDNSYAFALTLVNAIENQIGANRLIDMVRQIEQIPVSDKTTNQELVEKVNAVLVEYTKRNLNDWKRQTRRVREKIGSAFGQHIYLGARSEFPQPSIWFESSISALSFFPRTHNLLNLGLGFQPKATHPYFTGHVGYEMETSTLGNFDVGELGSFHFLGVGMEAGILHLTPLTTNRTEPIHEFSTYADIDLKIVNVEYERTRFSLSARYYLDQDSKIPSCEISGGVVF